MAKTAKYQQVIDWIKERLDSGELGSGDKLEPENEISAKFGVSRQTVRHALSLLSQEGMLETIQGSGSYVKTQQRLQARNEELSNTVTILSTYVDGYIFPRILQSMVKTLEKSNYTVRIMFTGNRLETEGRLLRRLIEENSQDPMIVEPVMSGLPNPNLKYYREIQKRGIPVLFFHSFYPELSAPHVCMKDREAGKMATEYLISQGHTKIGGIFKADDGQGRYRYLGYLEAMHQAGIAIHEKRISWIDTLDLKDLKSDSERVMKRLKDCTACVCYNDEVAHNITNICRQQGIKIPEVLSLVSIDNSELSALNVVPLTSVEHPMEAMGVKVADNLLKLIRNPAFDATYEFRPRMKIRSSVLTIQRDLKDEDRL